ncbi:MAG: response regulator [Limisphaerales bacterium]
MKQNLIIFSLLFVINGFKLCAELKQRHISRFTPIVFVSGQLSENDRPRVLEVGAVDFIVKPFGVEFAPRLLSHVRQTEVVA